MMSHAVLPDFHINEWQAEEKKNLGFVSSFLQHLAVNWALPSVNYFRSKK